VLGKTDFDVFTEEHARPASADEQEIFRTGQTLLEELTSQSRHGALVFGPMRGSCRPPAALLLRLRTPCSPCSPQVCQNGGNG
jgi:hypothetical protein